jgi:hypothetical protein
MFFLGMSQTSLCTAKPTTTWLFHLSLTFPPPPLGDFEIGSRGDVQRCCVRCGVAGGVATEVGVPGAAKGAAASTGLLGDDGSGADAGRNTLEERDVSLSDDEAIMTLGAAVVESALLPGSIGFDCGACEASNILSSV